VESVKHWATRLAIAEAAEVARTRVWAAAIAAAEETAIIIANEAETEAAAICSLCPESAMWEARPEVVSVVVLSARTAAARAAAAVLTASR
jgi:hypothetical protein